MAPEQAWGGFDTQNVFGYLGDLNPLSQQTGIARDDLATQRDQLLQPIESSYRTAMGGQGVDATSANLYNDPNFRSYAQTGQVPQSQVAQQGGGMTLGSLGSGSALAPFTGQFQAPTADQALQTPGLQYALQRAQQAIERSAAAKGTLLTGGLMRDLSENQIGMALQGYGDTYNRARSEFDLSRSIFEGNQDRPFDKLYRLGELGRPV
jgi:hypothetical protein